MFNGPEQLFEQFVNDGLCLIKRAVAEQWSESLVLDFKTAANNSGPIQPDDRKTLGKALSGFGNSEGGIIIWGIRADQQVPDEADVAKELKPIKKLTVFLSDLEGNTSQVASPAIIGVRHHAIWSDNDLDTGFAVSYVPRIEGDPAMNVVKGERRYYCRSGSSFIVMEPFMLSDRFHRRYKPMIELTSRIQNGGVDYRATPRRAKVEITVGIKNVGRAAARYPSLRLITPSNCTLSSFGLDGNGNTGLPKQATSPDTRGVNEYLFGGGADHIVYPHTTREVTKLTADFPLDSESIDDVTITYEVYALGSSAEGEFTITGTDLLKCVNRI